MTTRRQSLVASLIASLLACLLGRRDPCGQRARGAIFIDAIANLVELAASNGAKDLACDVVGGRKHIAVPLGIAEVDLLRIRAAPNDGTLQTFTPVLKPRAAPAH